MPVNVTCEFCPGRVIDTGTADPLTDIVVVAGKDRVTVYVPPWLFDNGFIRIR